MNSFVRDILRAKRAMWMRGLCALAWLICASASAAAQNPNDQCQKCHNDSSIASMRPESLAAMVRIPTGREPILRAADAAAALYVPDSAFTASAHAGIACVECHLVEDRLPHAQRLALRDCRECHTDVESAIATTPHAPSLEGEPRPSCEDCHGPPHSIAPMRRPRDYDTALKIVDRCANCHNEMERSSHNGEFNPIETYRENVHGKGLLVDGLALSANCVDCHGHHATLPASDPASPMHPLNAPDTCGQCHQGIEDIYVDSVHGERLTAGEDNAASCTTCHRSHGILEVDEPFLHTAVEECSNCHLELGRSYMLSFHGKATELGAGETAVCSSCHGAHDIQPRDHPDSRVAKHNLKETCGACHENVNDNFVQYEAHIDYRDRREHPAVFYTWLFMTTLLVSVLVVFIIHTLLWFQRSLFGEFGRKGEEHIDRRKQRMIRRFRPVHRLTHALIIISFMGLVATGFPLKYSYTVWASRMASMFGGIESMRFIHRFLALVTFGYAALHFSFLIRYFIRERPKPLWKFIFGPESMILTWRDVKDVVAMIRWFFWLGPKPKFERWTYFEKFDYWGEIWGVIVIGGSGLMLWAPTFFTRWLPGWILNCAMVVHSIEALLAASVIFLIHFFNTHLRPEKFPIDMVMLTGQMSESEMKEERGDEYERLLREGRLEERVVPPVSRQWKVLGTIFGVTAFLIGIALIVLALKTELSVLFG